MNATFNIIRVSVARCCFNREIGYFYTAIVVLEPSLKPKFKHMEKCHYWHCVHLSVSPLCETLKIRLDLNSITKHYKNNLHGHFKVRSVVIVSCVAAVNKVYKSVIFL